MIFGAAGERVVESAAGRDVQQRARVAARLGQRSARIIGVHETKQRLVAVARGFLSNAAPEVGPVDGALRRGHERIVVPEECLACRRQRPAARQPPAMRGDGECHQHERAARTARQTEERLGAYRPAVRLRPRTHHRRLMVDIGVRARGEERFPFRQEAGRPDRRPVAAPIEAPLAHRLVATQLMRSPRSRSMSRRRKRASFANHSRSVACVGSALPSQTTVVSS